MNKCRAIWTLAGAAALLEASQPAAEAQQVFNADVVVKGSLCVGFDCPDGPAFGFDTEILRENNLRILFDDTSVAAGFPQNDWRIVLNDSAAGGASYFAVEDATALRQVFRVDAGAPSNALFVDSGGDVGIGTSIPVLDLHAVDGDTPGLRLEQNGSAGWSPQTWDIGANEANFFVRDVTNGSRLPLRLRPGAPTSSIDVSAGGDIGIGTPAPTAPLHIQRSGGTARILVEEKSTTQTARTLLQLVNNGRPQIVLANTGNGNEWEIGAGASLIIEYLGTPLTVLRLSKDGDLTIPGTITTGGSCSAGCDRVFSDGHERPSIERHAERMWAAGYLPAVGPTPEGGPMNLTDKLAGILNELEMAHVYIAELNARVAKLEEEMSLARK